MSLDGLVLLKFGIWAIQSCNQSQKYCEIASVGEHGRSGSFGTDGLVCHQPAKQDHATIRYRSCEVEPAFETPESCPGQREWK